MGAAVSLAVRDLAAANPATRFDRLRRDLLYDRNHRSDRQSSESQQACLLENGVVEQFCVRRIAHRLAKNVTRKNQQNDPQPEA